MTKDLFEFDDVELKVADQAVFASQKAIARSALNCRLDAGLSQAELAKRARTTQARVSEIESLKGDPKLSTLARVAFAMGYKIDMVRTSAVSNFALAPDGYRYLPATDFIITTAGGTHRESADLWRNATNIGGPVFRRGGAV